MKAYLIARVSTEDQKEALPAQVHRLLDYAQRRDFQYELVEFQESAYKGNRQAFRNIIAGIPLNSGVVAIAFDKVDRLTRDSGAEEVRHLKQLCEAGVIELHFPSDNLTITKDSPATDKMRLGLNGVLAQYYSDAISDNVKRRFEQKLRDGEWIGVAPIGYRNVILPNGRKWVEIDPFRAKAVQAAFERYASGIYSLKQICKFWRDEFGIVAGSSKMDIVLKNPFYYGEMRVKGQLYPHKYEPIIGRELFKAADQVRKGYKVEKKRWAGLPYAYRGLIRCATCDCRITFEKKKGLYVYGHCTQFKSRHGAAYVAEDAFTKQFRRVFEGISIPEDALRQVSEKLEASYRHDKETKYQRLYALDSEIAKYKNRMDRVYEDYIDEQIPEELYKRKFDEFKTAKKALETQRKNIELDKEVDHSSVNRLLQLSNQAPKLFEMGNFEERRGLINQVLSNLQLDGTLLRWKLKKPFDSMALCAETGNWLTTIEEVITVIKTDLVQLSA